MKRRGAIFSAALTVLPASAALACSGGDDIGLRPLLGAVLMLALLLPLCTVLWALKGWIYRSLLQQPVHKALARAQIVPFLVTLAYCTLFFTFEGHLGRVFPVASMLMFLLVFAMFLFAESKLVRKLLSRAPERKYNRRLAILNVIAALVIWFAIAATTLGFCGALVRSAP